MELKNPPEPVTAEIYRHHDENKRINKRKIVFDESDGGENGVIRNLFKISIGDEKVLRVEKEIVDQENTVICLNKSMDTSSLLPSLDMLIEYSLFIQLRDLMILYQVDNVYPDAEGLVFLSPKSDEYFSTLPLIKHIPLDLRDRCCDLMRRLMQYDGNLNSSKPTVVGCAAISGSGKSVLQLINMSVFAERTNGIAIEVDLSDEPMLSLKPPTGLHTTRFKDAIAVRILRRFIAVKCGQTIADECLTDSSSLIKSMVALSNPLQSALAMVVRCLNAPKDVKIQLCIKGLSKCTESSYDLVNLLAVIQNIKVTPFAYPEDTCPFAIPPVQLSFEVNSASELVWFEESSKGGLCIQSLTPLMFDTKTDPTLVPPILRMFFDPVMKQLLPRHNEARKVYIELANLMMISEGNPGRLSVVLSQLASFPIQVILNRAVIGVLTTEECASLVIAIKEWLDDKPTGAESRYQQILQLMDSRCNLSTNRIQFLISYFKDGMSCADVIEALAVDSTIHFSFPCGLFSKTHHRIALKASELGCCSFLDNGEYYFHVYYPLPILEYLPPQKDLNPCGQALVMLRDALKECRNFGSEDNRTGVCFTKCILFALLLYTRSCREYFEPAVFCETNCCGWMDDSYKLPCKTTIEYWKDIEDFPILRKVKPTVEQVKILIRKLNPDSSGAFFVATAQPTYVVGIFRTRSSVEYRMLLFQPINWMSNVSHDTVNLMAWKEFHPLLHECMWFKMNDAGGNQQTVSVKFSHIVLSASDINGIVCERKHQGAATLKTMLKWNPTAGYALLLAYNSLNTFLQS